jgi:hypothetical protein
MILDFTALNYSQHVLKLALYGYSLLYPTQGKLMEMRTVKDV